MRINDALTAVKFYDNYINPNTWKDRYYSIYDAYGRPSDANVNIYRHIEADMIGEGGSGLKVISANKFNFSAAYVSKNRLEVVIYYPSRWGVRVNIEEAEKHIERYKIKEAKKIAECRQIILDRFYGYIASLPEGAEDCFRKEIDERLDMINIHETKDKEYAIRLAYLHIDKISKLLTEYDEEYGRELELEELFNSRGYTF